MCHGIADTGRFRSLRWFVRPDGTDTVDRDAYVY